MPSSVRRDPGPPAIDRSPSAGLEQVPTDPEPLRILLTVHHPLVVDSGAPGATSRLADEYRKFGHGVEILSLDDLPRSLPVKARELLFPLFVALRIRTAQKSERLQIVDASTGDAWLWSLFRRRGPGRPLLVTRSHGLEHTAHVERLEESRRGHLHLSWKYPLYRGGLHLSEVTCSLRRADLVLLLNRHDLKYAVERLAVERKRIRLVAHGLSDDFIGRPLEPTPLERGSEIGIAQIGTYDVYKGTHYSARALTETLERHPKTRVSFFGAGYPSERVLSDFPASLHARIRVVPRYQRSCLPALLAGHQIKLFPTLSEGFGLALLEAMASGLAPVVTSTPGPLRIVRSELDALVVPRRDSDAIVRALHRLITDRSLLDRLRRNAHATAQGYRWSTVAAETISTYREFLAARDGRPKTSP